MNKISTLKNKEIPKIYMQLATLALTAVILVSTCLCTFLYYRHVKALENQAIAMSTIIDSTGYFKNRIFILARGGFPLEEIYQHMYHNHDPNLTE